MKGILRANLSESKSNYIATIVAIMLAVTFLQVCLGLTAATNLSMRNNLAREIYGANLVASAPFAEAHPLAQLETEIKRQHPEWTTLLRSENLVQLGKGTNTIYVSSLGLGDPRFDSATLKEGSRPASGQIGVEESTAKTMKLKTGSRVELHVYNSETDSDDISTLEVSGIYLGRPGFLPTAYLPENDLRAFSGSSTPSQTLLMDVSGNLSEAQAQVINLVKSLPHADMVTVQTTEQYIMNRLQQYTGGPQLLVALLVFPVIAGVTAIIVVSVTYSVMFSRRKRQLALLRAVGATKGQLRSLVWRETLAVGAIAAAGGVAVGMVLSVLINQLSGITPEWVDALATQTPTAGIASFLAGVLISVIAGIAPARAVGKVTPLAALAHEDSAKQVSKRRTLRLILGLTIFLLATLSMVLSIHQIHAVTQGETADYYAQGNFFLLAMFSGAISFLGLLLLVSVILPQLTWMLGKLGSKRAVLWRLAAENSRSNPRRTGATGAALTLGVTLVVMLLTGGASVEVSALNSINRHNPVDYTLSQLEAPLDVSTLDAVARVTGVVDTLPVAALEGNVHIPGQEPLLEAIPEDLPESGEEIPAEEMLDEEMLDELMPKDLLVTSLDISPISRSEVEIVPPGKIGIPNLHPELVGSSVNVESGGKTVSLLAQRTNLYHYQLNPQDIGKLSSPSNQATIRLLYLKIGDDLSNEQVQQIASDLSAVAPDASLIGEALTRVSYTQMIQALMWGAIAMLAVSIIVALVGVANTLTLSVMERRRENGLLRALGLTRGRLQSLLSIEALQIGLVAVLIGILAGIAYAVAGMHALPIDDEYLDIFIVVPPLVWIGGAVTVAVAVIASITPARLAGRVTPSEALARD